MQMTRGQHGHDPVAKHSVTRSHVFFVFATLLAFRLYLTPLKALLVFALHDDIYLYSGAIPLITTLLIYLERKRIFSRVGHAWVLGGCLIVAASGVDLCNELHTSQGVHLSIATLSFVILWAGIFALCYGAESLRAASFHLSLLLLMVPLPGAVLERAIFILRSSSVQVAGLLFWMEGIPFVRHGFTFALPGLDLQVAEQCSGIRSGLSFLVTSLLVGHFSLRTSWEKLALVLAAFPITVFKNGLRIVTIYGFSIHPSLAPMVPWLHRYAGIPFSFLGLVLLGAVVALFHRAEKGWQAGGRLGDEALAVQAMRSAEH